jgi:hypothetical protein
MLVNLSRLPRCATVIVGLLHLLLASAYCHASASTTSPKTWAPTNAELESNFMFDRSDSLNAADRSIQIFCSDADEWTGGRIAEGREFWSTASLVVLV